MNHTDIKSEGWIARLPVKLRPYAILMRLDRPIGWWLLLLPGWWGITLAFNGFANFSSFGWKMLVYFLFGAVLMRGAGCIINDLWDRDLDKEVSRTKSRPLASGDTPVFQAVLFLGVLLFISLFILLQTSGVAIWLGLLSIPFIATYPYMKRITWWPQAFLGITFNFSALIGWAAVYPELVLTPFILYAGCFFWTLGYDTIYAHQDKEDDQMVGIKSTALLFGERSKLWVGLFYATAMFLIFVAALHMGVSVISLVCLVFPAVHLVWQIKNWQIDDHQNSLKIFKSNRDFGLLVFAAFALSGF